jgi:hypothetical protein
MHETWANCRNKARMLQVYLNAGEKKLRGMRKSQESI